MVWKLKWKWENHNKNNQKLKKTIKKLTTHQTRSVYNNVVFVVRIGRQQSNQQLKEFYNIVVSLELYSTPHPIPEACMFMHLQKLKHVSRILEWEAYNNFSHVVAEWWLWIFIYILFSFFFFFVWLDKYSICFHLMAIQCFT